MNVEKIDEILGKLSEIEFSMESLSCILENLEVAYESKHEHEMQQIIWGIKKLVDSMSKELKDGVDELDKIILNNKDREDD